MLFHGVFIGLNEIIQVEILREVLAPSKCSINDSNNYYLSASALDPSLMGNSGLTLTIKPLSTLTREDGCLIIALK